MEGKGRKERESSLKLEPLNRSLCNSEAPAVPMAASAACVDTGGLGIGLRETWGSVPAA